MALQISHPHWALLFCLDCCHTFSFYPEDVLMSESYTHTRTHFLHNINAHTCIHGPSVHANTQTVCADVHSQPTSRLQKSALHRDRPVCLLLAQQERKTRQNERHRGVRKRACARTQTNVLPASCRSY